MSIKTIVLCILDGWGNGKDSQYNAISSTHKPCWNLITASYPMCNLSTSGLDVGLPEGQMGNSEVGHMNIGSGRIVMQSLQRINQEIVNIAENETLLNFIHNLRRKNGKCHIIGLISDGGVHSHQEHISKLSKVISDSSLEVVIHAFLDGRDTLPKSAMKYIKILEEEIKHSKNIKITTVSGRYYGMDRDNRLERTAGSYEVIAFAKGVRYSDAISLINESYKNNITDEFVEPGVIGEYNGINEEDGIIIANFRADRVIQLINALLGKIKICKPIKFSSILGMMKYNNIDIPYLFPPLSFDNTLGQVISDYGFKQLRIAETEKYAHVTFFFNCGREGGFPGEERVLVLSPQVATYDLKPEMSAFELTELLVKHIHSQKFKLIVVNYANADMVGHTGNVDATKKAILALDKCLAKVLSAVQKVNDTALIITADHGNAEDMFDVESGMPNTAHTLNSVPFIVCANCIEKIKLEDGLLCDIAPTILKLLNIKKPAEMTGKSLVISQLDFE